jgi:sulfite exporter TauE/SafE
MNLGEIDSSTAAFVAGLVTSLHCAGMCGPMACLMMPVKGDRSDAHLVSTVYHLGRLLSYSLLGALAGGFGHFVAGFLDASVIRWLPWFIVLFFIGLAFNWERFLPRLAAMNRLTLSLHGWFRKRSLTQAAAILGLATPLLPCGPLYFVLAASIISGSALKGFEFMAAFALGTIPLLWFAQSQFHWMRQELSPQWMGRLRVSLSLAAALMIAWRLRGTLGFEGPGLENFMCCF